MKSNIWKNMWPVWKERATVMPHPPPLPPFCQICNLAVPAASTEKDAENEWSPDAPDFIHLNTYARRARTATKTRLETYLTVLFLSADFLSCCSMLPNIVKSRKECKFACNFRGAAVSISVFPRARPHGRIWNKSRQAGIAHNTHAIRHHQDERRRTCTRHLSENHWPTTIYVWTLRTSPPTESDLCAELFRKSPLQPPGKPIRQNPPLTSFSNSHQSMRLFDNFPKYLISMTPHAKRSIFRARYNEKFVKSCAKST